MERVPEWARAEHMEMSIPLKELWKYEGDYKSMKKIVVPIVVIVVVLAGTILFTTNRFNTKDANSSQTSDSLYDKTDLGYLDEVLPEGTTGNNSEPATGNAPLQEEKEASPNESFPGPEIVELVNLRGDETMVYKLADGTYMDQIENRFTFNGTDAWFDEDGVEWNERVD